MAQDRLTELREFARRYTDAWCSQDAGRVAAFFAPGGSLTINGGIPAACAIIRQLMLHECAVPRLVHGKDLAMKPLLYVLFSMALATGELARISISPGGSDDRTGGLSHTG